MAQGDITIFNDAKLAIMNGTHDFDTDVIKFAILDATNTMNAAEVAPTLASYTQVGTSGSYTAPVALANTSLTNTAGVIKFDADDPAQWVSNGLNDSDARYGLIYNETQANAAICWLDFGSNIDMSSLALTVQWNAADGIITLT